MPARRRTPLFVAVDRRLWRIVSPRWMSRPLSGLGAARRGGRWNPPSVPALYLSETHATAIAEYNQDLEHSGTLIPFDLSSRRIVDLIDPAVREACAVADAGLRSPWKRIAYIDRARPPVWRIAEALIGEGAHGVRVPSVRTNGVNIVLWRWNADDLTRLSVVDPFGDLKGS